MPPKQEISKVDASLGKPWIQLDRLFERLLRSRVVCHCGLADTQKSKGFRGGGILSKRYLYVFLRPGKISHFNLAGGEKQEIFCLGRRLGDCRCQTKEDKTRKTCCLHSTYPSRYPIIIETLVSRGCPRIAKASFLQMKNQYATS